MDIVNEQSPLLIIDSPIATSKVSFRGRRPSRPLDRYISDDEQRLKETYVGERLPYSDYASIDFLHDLVSNNKLHFVPDNGPLNWHIGKRLRAPSCHSRSRRSALQDYQPSGPGFGLDGRSLDRHTYCMCRLSC